MRFDTDQTKLSDKEWRDLIVVGLKGGGRNRFYSAICPICLIGYDVDVVADDGSDRGVAIAKVISHINNAHSTRSAIERRPHRGTIAYREQSELR